MRPQDLYDELGMTVAALQQLEDTIAQQQVVTQTWSPQRVRVDESTLWSTEDTLTAATEALMQARAAVGLAAGHVEAAWAAVGRLSAEE